MSLPFSHYFGFIQIFVYTCSRSPWILTFIWYHLYYWVMSSCKSCEVVGNTFYHLWIHRLLVLRYWVRSYIWIIDELEVHFVLIMVNQRVVSMGCELMSCEHDFSEHHRHRHCTATVYIQSVPSFLTWYGCSNKNAGIPSMTYVSF